MEARNQDGAYALGHIAKTLELRLDAFNGRFEKGIDDATAQFIRHKAELARQQEFIPERQPKAAMSAWEFREISGGSF